MSSSALAVDSDPLLTDETALTLTTAVERCLAGNQKRSVELIMQIEPTDERDATLALLALQDLYLAPLDAIGDAVRFQYHPHVVALKAKLEQRFLRRVTVDDVVPMSNKGRSHTDVPHTDVVDRIRAIAKRDLLPPIYEWVAQRASIDDLRLFLALEGGPDGGFDDLVALCQVGLSGEPKLELARNYWDEMGRGELPEVHTELHRKMAAALRLARLDRDELPLPALDRQAIGSILATNRRLQPELIGALGLLEMQAGPRCRKVLQGLQRLDAHPDALPFYDEHARTDPRHGKDWLDHVIGPLSESELWSEGMVRGAEWRSRVNARFFETMATHFERL